MTWILWSKLVLLTVLSGTLAFPVLGEQVVFSEIFYHPKDKKAPEFVEIWNRSSIPRDICDWVLTDGVKFHFPGFNESRSGAAFLGANERMIVANCSETEFRGRYPNLASGVRVLGPWEGKLSNMGERIVLKDKNGDLVTEVRYRDGGRKWPALANGLGHSLIFCGEAAERGNDWRHWKASAQVGGNPGERDESWTRSESLQLRSVEADGDGSCVIAVANKTAEIQEIEGGEIRGNEGTLKTLTGTIAAREIRHFKVATPKVGQVNRWSLIKDGKTIDFAELRSPVFESPAWKAVRNPIFPGEWRYSLLRDNLEQGGESSQVVISEIMHAPAADPEAGEYIELLNRGDAAVNLEGWRFTSGVKGEFPKGTTLAAGQYFVVAKDSDAVGIADQGPDVQFAGRLANDGELVRLEDAFGNLVDEVDYFSDSSWPEFRHGRGQSLERFDFDVAGGAAWKKSVLEPSEGGFLCYEHKGVYLEAIRFGQPSDYRELHAFVAGPGRMVLRKIRLTDEMGADLLTENQQWEPVGNHWASAIKNGELHIVAEGQGDNRANHLELDVPGLHRNQKLTLGFEAKWVSGQPRLIIETLDHSFVGSFLIEPHHRHGTPGHGRCQNGSPGMDSRINPREVVRLDFDEISVAAGQPLRSLRFHVPDVVREAWKTGNAPGHSGNFPPLSDKYWDGLVEVDAGKGTPCRLRPSGSPRRAHWRRDLTRKFRVRAASPLVNGWERFVVDFVHPGNRHHNALVRYWLYLLGHEVNEAEFAMVADGAQSWRLAELIEPVDEALTARFWEDGAEGELFKVELDYIFDDQYRRHREASFFWDPYPRDQTPALANLHTRFPIRSRESSYSYTGLADLLSSAADANVSDEQLASLIDADKLTLMAAVRGYAGDWDCVQMQESQNAYLYRPPEGRWQYLHWDSDAAFTKDQPFLAGSVTYGKWLRRVNHFQLLCGWLEKLDTQYGYDSARLSAWFAAQKEVGEVDIYHYIDFCKQRRTQLRSFLEQQN